MWEVALEYCKVFLVLGLYLFIYFAGQDAECITGCLKKYKGEAEES